METPSHESKASLGCGTLILIALIVAIFSGGGMKQEIKNIEARLERIEQKLDAVLPPPDEAPGANQLPVEAEPESVTPPEAR